jgi:hypothetical protein
VQGSEGGPKHNQIEQIMSVPDDESARTFGHFWSMSPDDDISFEDFMTLGHMAVLARPRTPQRRRLIGVRRDSMERHKLPEVLRKDRVAIRITAEGHVLAMFDARFEAADVMTTRWLEIWGDRRGRFVSCDSPGQILGDTYVIQDLSSVPRVWWPISPHRAVCLVNDRHSERALFRRQLGRRKEVNTAMVRLGSASSSRHTSSWLHCQLARHCPSGRRRICGASLGSRRGGRCRVRMGECHAALPDN